RQRSAGDPRLRSPLAALPSIEVVWRIPDSLVPHFINTATFATRDFWPRRGASDAHTLPGSGRSEQRRRGQKEPSPGGLRRFSVLASLLLGHSPASGDAPSSRLARTENRRNKRGRIYETGYLDRLNRCGPGRSAVRRCTDAPDVWSLFSRHQTERVAQVEREIPVQNAARSHAESQGRDPASQRLTAHVFQ